ncbi:hypothetical protein SAMN04515695_2437 [Pseudovibrio sp. Tun.PSC04-5.I4]|nr:hypothetical protein SAMN04515695_2437 [Pseudovibrio sp. Tun.PSC04-5.I4]
MALASDKTKKNPKEISFGFFVLKALPTMRKLKRKIIRLHYAAVQSISDVQLQHAFEVQIANALA